MSKKIKECPECHHIGSGRFADYGAACQCKCHDVADAAPELLYVCRMAVGFAVDFRQRHPEDWQEFEDVGKLFALAKGAIRKAEGQP